MLNDRKHHKTDDYRLFAKSAEYAKLKMALREIEWAILGQFRVLGACR